jgi:hypothetical protein
MAEVNRPSKALVEIINEVAISGAEKTLQEAQEALVKINVTNPGVPSEERDLALLRIDEAKAGLARAKEQLKFAECLAEHHKLSPAAGINLLEVFEDEDELRNALLASFRFEVEVGYDGTMKLRRLIRQTEGGIVHRVLPNPIDQSWKFNMLPNQLDWLRKTTDYSYVPWWRTICRVYGSTYFHKDKFQQVDERLQENYFQRIPPSYYDGGLAELPRAAFVKSTGKLYVESPSKLKRAEVSVTKNIRECRQYIDVVMGHYVETNRTVYPVADLDGCSLFSPYLELIQHDIPVITGEVPADLVGDTQGPLVKQFRKDLRLARIPLFEVIAEPGTVDVREIYRRIGKYWEKLITAPMTEKTGEAYTSLRRACRRNDEAVEICATSIKGHFKFSVVREDRVWIVGQIFCPPGHFYSGTLSDVINEQPMHIHHEIGRWHGSTYELEKIGEVVSVGPCKFLIGYHSDQRPWTQRGRT